MRDLSSLLIVSATLFSCPALSGSGEEMRVSAKAAVVAVKPLPEGRRLISLPALEFTLFVKPQCAPDMQLDSMSISVADTRETFSVGDIDGQRTIVADITVPRRQVSPLAVDGFCGLNRSDDLSPSELLVVDAYTANISLRCAGENEHTIIYASQSLNLILQCEDEESVPETPPDQDASSTSILR